MSELLEKMMEGFYANPLDPREAVLLGDEGEPLAGVTIHHKDERSWGKNHLHLEEVRAMTPGGGRKVMELLTRRADALGATLAGTVKSLPAAAYGLRKMPQRRLMAWYKGFGFIQDPPGGSHVVRYPRVKGGRR